MRWIGNLAFLAAALGASSAIFASPVDDPDIAAVWAREADYWRFVAAGDAESYRKLWHEKFIGWPCGKEHPMRKERIDDWVRDVRDRHLQVAAELTREGEEKFGDVVIVHYSFTRVDTFPDGHVEGQGVRRKITHTWLRVADSWQIIGGMCGELQEGEK